MNQRPQKTARTTQKEHIITITICAIFSLLLLYNPAIHHRTHLTGNPQQPVTTDFYHFHWNLWWIGQTTQNQQTPYITNHLLNPYQHNLSLHTLTIPAYPIWAATNFLNSASLSILTIFWTATTLTNYLTYIFLRQQNANPALALTGTTLLTGSTLIHFSIKWTTLNLMGWFWAPLMLITWTRLLQNTQTNRRYAQIIWTTLLGITLWATTLTDLQYPLLLSPLILPYGLWTIFKTRSLSHQLQLITLAITSILIALTLLWFAGPLPYLLNYDRDVLATTPAERAPAIPFPEGYVWRLEQGISLGILPITLIIAALIAQRSSKRHQPSEHWLWLAISLPPLILSAGNSIQLFGTNITMPYVWLHELLGGVFRYPERFGNVFLLAALTFAMPTLSLVLPKRGWKAYAVGITFILAALIDTRLLRPTPLQPIPPHYDFYEEIGQEDHDYVIVEIPTAGSSGEGIVGRSEWVALQWYGIIHHKRMVNSHISRVDPWHYLWMETSDAMMSWLGQRRYLEPELVADQMRERIQSWPIGYFAIHTRFLPQNGPTLQEIIGFFNAQDDLVCPFTIENDVIVYRTLWHPDGCAPRTPPETTPGVYEIDLGSSGDERFIGWGWHWQEDVGAARWRWTGEYPEARLYVDLPPGSYTLSLAAQAFWETHQLSLLVNGQPAAAQGVGGSDTLRINIDALQEVSFDLPADLIGGGQHVEITLVYDTTIVPAEVGQSSDPRRLAIAVDWVRFTRQDGS